MKYIANKWGLEKKEEADGTGTGVSAGGLNAAESVAVTQAPDTGGFSDVAKPTALAGATTQFSKTGTMQGDDPNRKIYRDDYGWKMTDESYKGLLKQTSEYKAAVSAYEAQAAAEIAAAKARYQGEIDSKYSELMGQKAQYSSSAGEAESTLSKAYSKLGSKPTPESYVQSVWNKSDKVTVAIHDGTNIEGKYTVMKKDFMDWLSSSGLKYATANGGTDVSINVHQSGRILGQELHDAAGQFANVGYITEQWKSSDNFSSEWSAIETEWSNAKSQLDAVARDLVTQKTAAESTLSQSGTNLAISQVDLNSAIAKANLNKNTQVNNANAKYFGIMNAAKRAYEKKQAAVTTAYGYLSKMTTTNGVKDGTGTTE